MTSIPHKQDDRSAPEAHDELDDILRHFYSDYYSIPDIKSALLQLLTEAERRGRKRFFDNQFDINESWDRYHGNMTYAQFAEDYLDALSATKQEGGAK